MDKKKMKKGAEVAKELAEHVEHLATNLLTRETIDHLTKAMTEILKAANSTIEEIEIPKETKNHLIRAEKETVLALRDFLDAVLQELERIEKRKQKPEALKEIEIEQ